MSISWREACRPIFRHKKKVIAIFAGTLALVMLATLLMQRQYRSEAKLFVRLGRENVVLDPTANIGQSPVVAVPPTREFEINSVIEMLHSRQLIEEVVDAVGPAAILDEPQIKRGQRRSKAGVAGRQLGKPQGATAGSETWSAPPLKFGILPNISDRDRALTLLSEKLYVGGVEKSNVIRVSYDTYSPKLAQTVVQTLTDRYRDHHVKLNRTAGAYEFLDRQTELLHSQLIAAEQGLRDLQSDTGIFERDRQRGLMVDRHGRLEDDFLQAKIAAATSGAEIGALHDKLGAIPATHVSARTRGFSNEAADAMREQLYALQLKEQDLLSKYKEIHPEVAVIRKQLAAAKAIFARENEPREQFTTAPSSDYEEVKVALVRQEPLLAGHQERAASLQNQLDGLAKDLATLNENELKVAEAERQVQLLEGSYRRYAENLEQARIDSALELQKLSNISVAQPATYEPTPVRPRLLLNALAGIMLATVLGLGSAFFLEQGDRRLKSADDIERQVGLETLVAIPRMEENRLTPYLKT